MRISPGSAAIIARTLLHYAFINSKRRASRYLCLHIASRANERFRCATVFRRRYLRNGQAERESKKEGGREKAGERERERDEEQIKVALLTLSIGLHTRVSSSKWNNFRARVSPCIVSSRRRHRSIATVSHLSR